MPRVVRSPVAFFSLLGLLVILPFVVRYFAATPLAAQAPITPTSLRTALIRAGLDAEALSASGVSAAQTSNLVTLAQSLLASEPTRLTGADASWSSARTTRDALERKIQSGLASQEEIASFASATSALTSAENERAAALDSLFNAATAQLSEGQRSLLTTIRSNRGHGVPIEFLAADRSEAEWLALRNALSNERIKAKYEEPASATCQALLAGARANATVAAAKSAHDTNLAAVTSAWDSASASH